MCHCSQFKHKFPVFLTFRFFRRRTIVQNHYKAQNFAKFSSKTPKNAGFPVEPSLFKIFGAFASDNLEFMSKKSNFQSKAPLWPGCLLIHLWFALFSFHMGIELRNLRTITSHFIHYYSRAARFVIILKISSNLTRFLFADLFW